MAFLSKQIIGDRVLFVAVLLLLFGSLPFAYSASGQEVFSNLGGNYSQPLIKRLLFSVISVAAMLFIANKVSLNYINRYAVVIYGFMMLLLLITLATTGTTNDARRDLSFDFLPFSIQTAAFAKVAMVIYAASVLARNYHSEESRMTNAKHVLIAVALMAGLTMSHGLSTTLILLFTILFMIIIAGIDFKKIYKPVLIVIAVPVFYLLIAESLNLPYRMSTWDNRITAWIESFSCESITYSNMQACLSKSAIADGGLFGQGLGQSPLRYYLPEAHSDFIYSYIVDEAGIVVGTIILILYMIIFFRGIQIARNAQSVFPAILALGLTFLIVSQALLNIGVAVGLLPVTGQPLPFISRGGSALLAGSIAVGILLNISKLGTENNIKEK